MLSNNVMQKDLSIWAMYQHADMVVKVVMLGLLFASIITWAIFFTKSLSLIRLRIRLNREQQMLATSETINSVLQSLSSYAAKSHTRALLYEVQQELAQSTSTLSNKAIAERIASRLERRVAVISRQIGQGNGFLATIGTTAPFVGLFGTVWGIMNSFISIAKMQTTNLAVVAPGIAEALLATAMGLIAAIPAVVIYNLFVRMISIYRLSLADIALQITLLQSRDK